MITKLKLTNFRGNNNNYNFKPGINVIKGKNGAGKSTIKEALCFGLFGTDSHNSKRLSHLISTGQTEALVVMNERHARTLSGHARIDFKLGEGSRLGEILQTPKEALLASFMPGFFMQASTEVQHKLLDTLLPKKDRVELLEKLSGVDRKHFTSYDLNKRIDLVSNSVAIDRRSIDREIATLTGELNVLTNICPPPINIPRDVYSPFLKTYEIVSSQWETYQQDLNAYNRTRIDNAANELFNQDVLKRREEINAQIEALTLVALPEYKGLLDQVDELKSKLLPEPQGPAKFPFVESEYCRTCGQAVSPRHVEHVKAENARLDTVYAEELAKVRQHNAEIQLQISTINHEHDRMKREYLKARDHNDKVCGMKNSLMRELSYLKLREIKVELPAPVEPEKFDKEEYSKMKEGYSKYLKDFAVYTEQEKRYKEALCSIEDIKVIIEDKKQKVETLKKIEDALKILPQEELKLRLFNFEIGAKVVIGDEISVFLDNVPYAMLSTGQRMKIDISICTAINKLLPCPLNMIFIDDADLIDGEILVEGFKQVFICKVSEGELCVQ